MFSLHTESACSIPRYVDGLIFNRLSFIGQPTLGCVTEVVDKR